MAKNVQRRLAEILAADVVGYSRLIGEDIDIDPTVGRCVDCAA